MALRNLDLDSAIRGICHGDGEAFGALLEACNAKLKALGLKADGRKAVGKAPRHAGRRNPLAGKFKGSGDINVRSLLDFVETIEPLPKLRTLAEGEEATADDKVAQETHAAMAAAHEQLVTIQATIVAHAK